MKSVNVFSNPSEKSKEILQVLKNKLNYHGLRYNEEYSDQAFANICIGGDGSFLRAVHDSNFSQIPFAGINTGTLGFFQEILDHQIDSFLIKLKSYQFSVDELFLLDAEVLSVNESYKLYALNDFVVSSSDHSPVKIDVYVDNNHLEHFAGDGLIVSTPAGSTAYNFSAGGSILYQQLKGYQLAPVAPIHTKAYRSLQSSIVLSDKEVLTMKPSSNNTLVTDGHLAREAIEEINFTMPGKYINKLVFDENWYWKNLKDKFL